MNTGFDLRADLDELIQTAYGISSTREEDADDALRAAREQQLSREETRRLEMRVVGLLKSASRTKVTPPAAKRSAKPKRTRRKPDLHLSWDSARTRIAMVSRVPHRGAALLLLLVFLLPLAGLAIGNIGGVGSTASVNGPVTGVRTQHSYDRLEYGRTIQGYQISPGYNGGPTYSAETADGELMNGFSSSPTPTMAGGAHTDHLMLDIQAQQKNNATSGLPNVIRTDKVIIRVKRNGAQIAANSAASAVGLLGGSVVSKSRSGLHSGVTLIIRVPTQKFGAMLAKLYGLGKVLAESMQSQNVGLKEVNLAAKLKNLEAQRNVLLALFNRSTSVVDTIRVQQTLSGVQSNIDTTQADIRYLGNQTALGTITVNFRTSAPPVKKVVLVSKPQQGPIAKTLATSAHAAGSVIGGTIILLGYALPLALLVLLCYGVFRFFRRNSGQSA